MKQHRISLKLGLLLAAAWLFTAGCPADKSARESEGRNVAPSTTRVKGGTARLPLEVKAGDPAFITLDFSDARLFALARCLEVPLVRSDAFGQTKPGLASSWQTSDDGKTWVFALRPLPGHDQDPGFAGTLVQARFEQLLRGPADPLRAQLCDLLLGAQEYAEQKAETVAGLQPEAGQLTLQLTRKNMLAPLWLSQPGLGVLPKPSAPSAGFGPFTLASVAEGVAVLKPNAQALDGAPLLDELHFVLEPDRAKQLELFKTGKLDTANLDPDAVNMVVAENDPALTEAIKPHETAAMLYGLFNMTRFPWADSKFQSKLGLRQAMNFSLDRENLQDQLAGQVTGWTHFLPQTMKDDLDQGLLQEPLYPLVADVTLAMAGEKDANHEQGSQLIPGMDLGFLDQGILAQVAKPMLEDWLQVSVKMRPFAMHQAALRLRLDTSSHEILLRLATPGYASPDALYYPILYSNLPGIGGNWSGLKDADVDKRIQSAQAAVDNVSRKALYRELSSDIEQRALCIFIGYYSPTLLINPRLQLPFDLSPYDFDASLPAQDLSQLGFMAGGGAQPDPEAAAD
jgi:ABC-type oligopeptide transport system substrate-binding subunit